MDSTSHLPAHLQRFVHEQLMSGRFATEADVIRAALDLLKERSPGQPPPNAPADLAAAARPAAGASSPRQAGRRSPRGLLADIYQAISPDEIDEARREMWSNFPRDGL